MKEYVLGFVTTKNFARVLLIRKVRPAWQQGKLNGIGGHIEAGEEPHLAMEREFEEEVGEFPGERSAWTHYLTMIKEGEWKVYVFYATIKHNLGWDSREFREKISGQNAVSDEPVGQYAIDDLLHADDTISNLPGIIGLIRDTVRTRPVELRY